MKSKHRWNTLVWMVLLAGLILSTITAYFVQSGITAKRHARVESEIIELENAFVEKLHRYESLLLGARGLFRASVLVEDHEWVAYLSGPVLEAELSSMFAAGYSGYVVDEATGDTENVHYVFSTRALEDKRKIETLELGAYPEIARAFQESVRRNDAAVASTGAIDRLLGREPGDWMVMVLPIFRNNASPERNPVGSGDVTGYVYAIIDLEKLLQEVNLGVVRMELSVPPIGSLDHVRRHLSFGEYSWEFVYGWSDPELEGDRIHPFSILVFCAGIAISGLMAAFFSRIVKRRFQAERLNIELTRANEKLRELDRLKSEFIATVSHELRTPAALMLGGAEVLERQAEKVGDSRIAHVVEIFRRNAERMVRLVENLLDLSTIDAGKLKLHYEPLPLSSPARHVLEQCEPLLHKKKLAIRTDFAAPDPILSADAARLNQVVLNLLDNAVRFARDEIRIATGILEGFAFIRVEDDGPGIPEDKLPNLFDRFVQIRSHVGRRRTGLGLGICKAIVEAHGGRIEACNRVDGPGATFAVFLPIPAPRRSGVNLPGEAAP